MKTKTIKYPYYWLTFIMSIGFTANAQKLPNVQQTGLYAPADVKVDGKATEWDNKFQAYNKSTSLYYTMANNNDNLYLTIQATDKVAMQKILGGGFTLTLNKKDKSANAVSITTPYLLGNNRSNITKIINSQDPIIDTELAALNNVISAGFKEISVKGIAAILNSVISVYNEYGIKLVGLIDINKAYICELAIPLKYIDQLSGAMGTFNYIIKLNGVKLNAVAMKVNGENANLSPAAITEIAEALSKMGGGVVVPGTARSVYGASPMELMNPTDFSGTYTIMKK